MSKTLYPLEMYRNTIGHHKNEEVSLSEINVTSKIMNGGNILVLIRGLPGSGKSAMAERILANTMGYNTYTRGRHIFSADDFFCVNGIYCYNPKEIVEAHEMTQRKSFMAMYSGVSPVIIDNTNIEINHMEPYISCAVSVGYKVEVLDTATTWRFNVNELVKRNRHGVPRKSIENMFKKYVPDLTVAEIMTLCNIKYSNEVVDYTSRNSDNDPVKNSANETKKSCDVDMTSPPITDFNENIENAWGINMETLKSWNIVKSLDEVVNHRKHFFSSMNDEIHNCNTINTETASTNTNEKYFIYDESLNSKTLSPNLKILQGRNRSINTGATRRPQKTALTVPPRKLTLAKSCQTDGIWNNCTKDIATLSEMFPNIQSQIIRNYYKECGKDLKHTLDQLLKDAFTLSMDTSDAHNVSDEATLSVSDQYIDSDAVYFNPAEVNNKETSIDAKAYDDNGILDSNDNLSLDDIELELGNDKTAETNQYVTLSFSEQTILELENMFPEIACQCDLDKIKNIQPIVELPRKIAKQLFLLFVVSGHRQVEEFNRLQNGLLSEQDELCAKQLQEHENNEFVNLLTDSLVHDHVLSNRVEAGLSDKEKNDPESLMIALTRRKLQYHFPNVSEATLNITMTENNNDYCSSIEALKKTYSYLDDKHSIRDPPLSAKLLEEVKKDYEMSRFLEVKENDRVDPKSYRNQAFKHIDMRNMFIKKADKYRRNINLIGLGEFYMHHVHEQSKYIERANILACTGWIEIKTVNFTVIDLHFLYVKEAVIHLDIFLDINIQILRNERSESVMMLSVITGQGNNSPQNVPKVKIAVEQRLKLRGIQYKLGRNNPGLLKIKIHQTSKYSSEIENSGYDMIY